MFFDNEAYEEACRKEQKNNEEYLWIFEQDLTAAGLAEKTITRHLRNVDFYLNTFLLKEDPTSMADGVSCLDMFLGDFFIRKCMWSTPGSIKSNAASIKKFYKCMADHGKIAQKDYDYLCREIRENLSNWQTDCEIYNDPDAPNPFAPFLF